MNLHGEEASFNSQYGEEYAITLEFELQREKQKNKILEQRLRNKEMFIVEMKKMQSQMEVLSEKWRQQLLQERQKREILQNVTLREYVESIAELEHKINLLEGNGGQKKQRGQQRMQRNRSNERMKKQSEQIKGREVMRQKQQVSDLLQNFASRFLEMYKIYHGGQGEQSLKKKLKAGWKWIKEVVKQWEQYEKSLKQIFRYASECEQNGQQCEPWKILNKESSEVSNDNGDNDA